VIAFAVFLRSIFCDTQPKLRKLSAPCTEFIILEFITPEFTISVQVPPNYLSRFWNKSKKNF
jgi:hypothetical protein